MPMKTLEPGGVKVYNVSIGKSLPDWVQNRQQRRKLEKNDTGIKTRLELIQDFNFPCACQKLKVTEDEQFVIASGNYPPQTKVFDVANLSLKFSRNFDSEVTQFEILSEDYSKLVYLCSDRYLRFHAKFGHHHEVRLPCVGRDMTYVPYMANLLVVGNSSDVFRLDLCEGRFYAPLPTKSSPLSAIEYSSSHGLVACTSDSGVLECFDLRQKTSVGSINAAKASGAAGEGLTSLKFDDSGLRLAVGTSNGLVSLFDLRSQTPLVIKDHMYGSPIVDLKFCTGGIDLGNTKSVMSTDRHIVKVWETTSGKSLLNIEPRNGLINDVCLWKGSGLVMVANEESKMQVFFAPSLGPAPKWCSFLEGLTEELEEDAATVLYDDYRFVSLPDLTKLGLAHLIGSPMLKAYMHGYFLDNRLYKKAKSITDPHSLETQRQKQIEKKLEEEKRSRIGVVRKVPKVNVREAARILMKKKGQEQTHLDTAATQDNGSGKRKREPAVNPMDDSRFAAMFENPSFTIDEQSEEYRILHPSAPQMPRPLQKEVLEEFFSGVGDEDGNIQGAEEATGLKTGAKPPVLLAARNEAALNLLSQPEVKIEFEKVALGDRATQASTKEDERPPAFGNVQFTLSASDESDGERDRRVRRKTSEPAGRGRHSKHSKSPGGRGPGRGRGGRGRASGRGRGRRGGRR